MTLSCDQRHPAEFMRGLGCHGLVLLAFLAVQQAVSASEQSIQQFSTFAAKYCYECHGSDKPKEELDIQRLLESPGGLAGHPDDLELILTAIQDGDMPPRKAKAQPTAAESKRMADLLDGLLRSLAEASRDDPGLVVMPRLNPSEYNHVIRDLTGVEIDAARYFSKEGGAGEGFANVGEAQTMTLGQFESYLEASRVVTSHLRASPLHGFRWDELPRSDVPTWQAGQEDLVLEMRQALFQEQLDIRVGMFNFQLIGSTRYRKLHAAYFEACWKYKHRRTDGNAEVLFGQIASEYEKAMGTDFDGFATVLVDPLVMRKWWDALHRPYDASAGDHYRAELVRLWNAMPGPDEADEETRLRYVVELGDWAEQGYGGWRDVEQVELKESLVEDDKNKDAPAIKELFLVATDYADGNENEFITWTEGFFIDKSGKRTPWQDAGIEARLAGSDEPVDLMRATVRAPAVIRIEVPEGAKSFEVKARVDAGRNPEATVQAVVAKKAPHKVDQRLYRGKLAFGTKMDKSGRDERFDGGWKKLDLLTGARNVPTPTSHYLEKRYQIIGHLHLDPAYFGAVNDLGQETEAALAATNPYFLSVPEIHGVSDEAALHRIKELEKDLVAEALPPLQDLERLARRLGIESHPLQWSDAEAAELTPADRAEWQRLKEAYLAEIRPWRARAKSDLSDFVARAWRRPPGETELAGLLARYDEEIGRGSTYDRAIKVPLRIVLTAPQFLYRCQETRGQDGLYPLTGRALADRLSFALWASIPDETLLKAFTGNEIAEDKLRQQARRMLQDKRSRALATEFAAQWFQFEGFAKFTGPNPKRFPEFTPSLAQAMYEEAVWFVSDLVQNDRPILNLIDSDYTFANEALAKLYGIPGVEGGSMRRVELTGDAREARGGVVTMGAILTRNSSAVRTSPVRRGVWLLQDFLGVHLPPPPPNTPPLSEDESDDRGRSIPEQLAAHRADASCAKCHNRIDPLGLSLESFDPIGKWRTKDGTGSEVVNSAAMEDGEVIRGVAGLKNYLKSQQDTFVDHFCRKLTGYVLGRAVLPGDRDLITRMKRTLAANDYRFSAALEEILVSKQFRFRHQSWSAVSRHSVLSGQDLERERDSLEKESGDKSPDSKDKPPHSEER
jgi:hypothetical protein